MPSRARQLSPTCTILLSSAEGINGFSRGDLLVGITNIPMSVLQETQLKKFKKFTIPQVSTHRSCVGPKKAQQKRQQRI